METILACVCDGTGPFLTAMQFLARPCCLPTHTRGELLHIETAVGIKRRCDPPVMRSAFLTCASSHTNLIAQISSCEKKNLCIDLLVAQIPPPYRQAWRLQRSRRLLCLSLLKRPCAPASDPRTCNDVSRASPFLPCQGCDGVAADTESSASLFCFGDDSHRRDACHSHHCEDRRDAETAH